MAIDKSMINQYDEQLQSTDYNETIRNCPTPQLLFDDLNFDSPSFQGMMDMNFGGSNYSNEGSNSAQIVASDVTHMSGTISQNVDQPTYVDMSAPSTSFINTGSPFSAFGDFNIAPDESFQYEESKTSLALDTTVALDSMSVKGARQKDKCMSRNAVLARQNREKKKNEHHSLTKRVKEVEEENATLKKKVKELTESHTKLVSRNTYLETIIENLPQIKDMVDHMMKYNGPGPAPKLPSNPTKKT